LPSPLKLVTRVMLSEVQYKLKNKNDTKTS